MNNVTTATSFPPLCRHYCQHGQKCEAQEVSWSRTNKQLEAWLRPRPRITGSSAEKLARIGGTFACWVQYITESTESGAMYRLRGGFSFFLANSHNRGQDPIGQLSSISMGPHASESRPHAALCGLDRRPVPAHCPMESGVVSVGCSRFGCLLQQTCATSYPLALLAQNHGTSLTLYATAQGTFRATSVIEDRPRRVRASQGSRRTCTVSATGRRRVCHSAPRSRS